MCSSGYTVKHYFAVELMLAAVSGSSYLDEMSNFICWSCTLITRWSSQGQPVLPTDLQISGACGELPGGFVHMWVAPMEEILDDPGDALDLPEEAAYGPATTPP